MLKKLFLITALSLFFLFGFSPTTEAQDNLEDPNYSFDLGNITHEGIVGGTRQSWVREGINYVLGRVIQVMASIIGAFAVLMMSFGGFLMLSSAGNEEQYKRGVQYIQYALIGLAFALGAYMLVIGVQVVIRSVYG